jgi:hypothetical protein
MALKYNALDSKRAIYSKYLDNNIYNLMDSTYRIPKNGFTFKIYRVTPEYIARPDLISVDFYNTTGYADIICKLNGISNPFELNENMEIILPEASDIANFYSSSLDNIDYNDNDQLDKVNTIVKKTKRDKNRRPNEAIIGDERFKIDLNTGIITY